jgi:4'-phosphopantetheinyl transferase
MPVKSAALDVPNSAPDAPHANEVVLWWMAVESPPAGCVARWYALLDEGERARADRFYFVADREIFIAAHALRRVLLAHVDGLPAADWKFAASPAGKPEIAPALNRSRWRFNLSHTRGLVACAVGIDYELGIDVEATDGVRDVLALAERFFAEDELALLRRANEDQRQKAFFRIWTLKEAYIKATGEGLARPLNSFAFGLDPITFRTFAGNRDDIADWQFEQFDATPRHIIALAERRASLRLRTARRQITVDEL